MILDLVREREGLIIEFSCNGQTITQPSTADYGVRASQRIKNQAIKVIQSTTDGIKLAYYIYTELDIY